MPGYDPASKTWIATASEASHPPDNALLGSAGRKTGYGAYFRTL